MDPRTLRKIIKSIMSDPLHSNAFTRINGYRYLMTYHASTDMVSADPQGRSYGDGGAYRASTWHDLDGSHYREGGEVYRKAVEWCHEVLNEIKKLRRGKVLGEA